MPGRLGLHLKIRKISAAKSCRLKIQTHNNHTLIRECLITVNNVCYNKYGFNQWFSCCCSGNNDGGSSRNYLRQQVSTLRVWFPVIFVCSRKMSSIGAMRSGAKPCKASIISVTIRCKFNADAGCLVIVSLFHFVCIYITQFTLLYIAFAGWGAGSRVATSACHLLSASRRRRGCRPRVHTCKRLHKCQLAECNNSNASKLRD